MKLIVIIMEDPSKPVEVQQWLDENPEAVVQRMLINGNLFYLLY